MVPVDLILWVLAMSLKRLPLFTLLAVFALSAVNILVVQPVQAQMTGEEDDDSLNLVTRGAFAVVVQRALDGKEGDFDLHFSNVGVVSGCVGVEDAEITLHFTPKKIDIIIEDDPQFVLRNEEVHYGNYSCDIQTHTLSFDVRLNRDELMGRLISKIGLKSKKYGRYSDVDVNITKDRIEFVGKSPGGSSFETYWFYPSNTVILHAPSARSFQDVGPLLDAFADKHGLVPLRETFEKFEQPVWVKNIKFYTDPRGEILGRISSEERDTQVGAVQPTKTMYGPDGAMAKPYDLPVYARKPGLYD